MDSVNSYQNSDTITDCFGMEYRVLKMQGSGFCLYHSLSYSLTGNDRQYVGVIDDCLTVFQNIPELFRLRTNFGSYGNSSLTIDDYALYMQQAIQLIQADHSVDSHAYGDEGHIAAISLLYDITVFTYFTQTNSWYVFNESSQHGYICLLNLPDHFDVLHGTDGPPAIPLGAHTLGVNRHNFSTSVDAWNTLQRNCSFQYVFRFPQNYSGVKILNNPVVACSETCISSNIADDVCTENPYLCDYDQCSYSSRSAHTLSMHKMRCHSMKNALTKNNSLHGQKDIRNIPVSADNQSCTASDVTVVSCMNKAYLCDYEQCNYTGKSVQSLSMHKVRCHTVKTVSTKKNNSRGQKGSTDGRHVMDTTSDGNSQIRIDSVCKHTQRRSHIIEYICDFEHCGYVGKNCRTLQIHKTKRHLMTDISKVQNSHKESSQVQTTVAGVNDMEIATCTETSSTCIGAVGGIGTHNTAYDADSCVRIDSNDIRRSEHSGNKRKASFTDSQPGGHVSRKVQAIFDINSDILQHEMTPSTDKSRRQKKTYPYVDVNVEPDDALVSCVISADSDIRRSTRISDRKRKCEGGKPQSDVAENSESTFLHVKNISNRHTKKSHLKKSFSQVISECERKFIPTTMSQQNDPLYEKLKVYHDDLLRSVSNTTTEKISAEILDVVENVSLTDTSERRYLWSVNDEERLNDLNKTCKLLQPRTQWTWGAPDDTEQGQYNDKRMQLCVTKAVSYTHLTLPTIYSV